MKNTRKLSLIVVVCFVILAIVFSSCGEGCIEGNGTIITETREVSNFTSVALLGDFDVYIEQSKTYEVIVEADENILPYVITENRSTNTLELRHANNRCLDGTRPVKITIKTPELYRITNSGSGEIKCDYVYNNQFDILLSGSGVIDCYKLDTRDLQVTLSGSGNIVLNGVTVTSDMLISGSGHIKAYDMDQDECYVEITGSGTAYVYAFDYLKVNIPGSGNVFYRGAPDVDVRIDGGGRVIEDNK
jgi:hypothetical protein